MAVCVRLVRAHNESFGPFSPAFHKFLSGLRHESAGSMHKHSTFGIVLVWYEIVHAGHYMFAYVLTLGHVLTLDTYMHLVLCIHVCRHKIKKVYIVHIPKD